MPDVIEQQGLYISSFRALEREFAAHDPRWLTRIRQEAIRAFADLGFPTIHDEEWRFTNIAPLTRVMFQVAPDETETWKAKGLEQALPGGSQDARLVFVNGHYSERLSSLRGLPRGVEAGS